VVQGLTIKFNFGGIFPFGVSKLKFYSMAFTHFGTHWGLFGFKGQKSNFTVWNFSFWGGSQTQNLLRGLLPFWGPIGMFWGSWVPKISADVTRKQT
jgi:hypothetical protein